MILKAKNITYQLPNGLELLKGINVSLIKGQTVGILGVNGSGKTTLLNCLTGVYSKVEGDIQFLGKDLNSFNSKELAQHIGIMHQLNYFPFDFTVSEMVEMGRYPHLGKRLFLTERDKEIVVEQLTKLDLLDKKYDYYSRLSGGEKQRVLLARALVQTPELLVLDEPTNHLDMYQKQTMLNLIKQLKQTTLCVLHDVSLAYEFCDKVYLLKEGRVIYSGATEEILTPEVIRDVFGISMDVVYSHKSKKNHLVII